MTYKEFFMLYHLVNGEQVSDPEPFPGEDICVMMIDSDVCKIETMPFNSLFTIDNYNGLYTVIKVNEVAAISQVEGIAIPDKIYDVMQLDDLVTVLYMSGNEVRYRKLIISNSYSEYTLIKDGLVSLNNQPFPTLETVDSVRVYKRLNHDGFTSQSFKLSTKERINDNHPLRPRGINSITTYQDGYIVDVEFTNGIKVYRRELIVCPNHETNTVSASMGEVASWQSDYIFKSNLGSVKVHGMAVLFTYININKDGHIDTNSFRLEYVIDGEVFVKEFNTATS